MAILGYNGHTDGSFDGNQRLFGLNNITMPVNGIAKKIGIYTHSPSNNTVITHVALYNDNGSGRPGTFLIPIQDITVTNTSGVSQWWEVDVSALNVILESGKKYIIGWASLNVVPIYWHWGVEGDNCYAGEGDLVENPSITLYQVIVAAYLEYTTGPAIPVVINNLMNQGIL